MKKNNTTTEEYLETGELSERIKYKRQSLYNKIYKKEFVIDKHYIKPSSRKILFKWTAILDWLGDKEYYQKKETDSFDYIERSKTNNSKNKMVLEKCRIKI